MRVEAWVTSAVEDGDVDKALVLASSLRRVRTAKKLVVLASLDVAKSAGEKLRKAFDLVSLFQPETPNGLNHGDYAKLEGFSLQIFRKCVYLSPNTIVVKNCDEIFEKYKGYSALPSESGEVASTSVFVFTPNLERGESLKKIVKGHDNFGKGGSGVHFGESGQFAKSFTLWLNNNFPNWEGLDEQYNVKVDLMSGEPMCLSSKVSVANFGDAHPLDMSPAGDWRKGLQSLGLIERVLVELCGKIVEEDVRPNLGLPPAIIPTHSADVFESEPVAIVGMSLRLPGSRNEGEFWDMLINGREGIRMLPDFRWTREATHYPCQNRNVQGGFLHIPVDEFDGKFFGISGTEAELLDPQQRLLHEVTWEALEDAMIEPASLRATNTGIFVGTWLLDYRDMLLGMTDLDFYRGYTTNSIASSAARLSHLYETTGPSIGTEAACASAMVAIDVAFKSLRNHDSNLALVCGVNLFMVPFEQDTFRFVVAPDGRCKTFDEGADGFGRAEGCVVFVMKRLSDAIKDEDNILGLIRGSAVTQEGVSKSIGTPTVHCESLAMELALKDGNVDPLEVSYVEAHGTGTQVGDPMEMASITKAYSKGRSEPLMIGSVKTNVGHTESCSALTGIAKVLLALKNETIPPHINLKRLNPAINLDVIPATIPTEPTPWPKLSDKPRMAGVSSFGISGADGHIIIQEPPVSSFPKYWNTEVKPRPLHIMKISAKSPESMEELLATYENIFAEQSNPDLKFEDYAYSANYGRSTFNHRAVIVASDFEQATKILREKSFKSSDVQVNASKLCFLFTGQGSQYPNMGAKLYDTSPVFRFEFDKCDKILKSRYGINMRGVLWGQQASTDGSSELSRTLYSQTSIFCIEYCLLRLWESWGVKPDFVMGHSLGEFAAAVAVGALGFEDALMLVAERSRLIDSLPRGKMLVLKADQKTVDATIENFKQSCPSFWVDYAALNAPDQTVVAGDSNMITEFATYCGEKGIKTIVLASTHAFHSRHMEPMLESYRKVAEGVRPPRKIGDGDAAPKYISGMEGTLINLDSINSDYWVRHTREPVRYMEACKTIQSEGCSIFLELGPHPVLSALTMMNLEGQSITALPTIRRNEEEWTTILDSLAKLYLSDWAGQVEWKGFDRYYKRTQVPLPFYPFNRKRAWRDLEGTLPKIHPLLGKPFPTHCGHSIFEKNTTLKNTPFIQDHVIGTTVIFPAAAFLEMTLAGGHAAVQMTSNSGFQKKPQRPVGIRNLMITSPLAFPDPNGVYTLQTSAKLDMSENDDEIRYAVGVQRYVQPSYSFDGVGEWIAHATATYLPVPKTVMNEQLSTQVDVDIPAIQQSWKKTGSNSEFYDWLPEVGLRFGPKFKTLEVGWKGQDGMLFGVKVPEDNAQKNYLIHPILADAMIQANMLWTSKDKIKKMKLQVPVQVEEFMWLQASDSPGRYIHASTSAEGKTSCLLLDDKGRRLAYMAGVDFLETSVKLIEGAIQQQQAAMPQLWREVWRNTPLNAGAGAEAEADSAESPPNSAPTPTLQKDGAGAPQPPPSWLIFHNNSKPSLGVAEGLKEKLVEGSRTGRMINRTVESCEDEKTTKQFMKLELNRVLQDDQVHGKLEGIVYLWGMSDDGINERDQAQVSLPLLSLVQVMSEVKMSSSPRLVVVTQGTADVNGSEITNPTAGTLHGIIKSLANERPELHISSLDLSPDQEAIEQVDKVWQELWTEDSGSRCIAFRDEERLCTKLVSTKVNNYEPLALPSSCDRYELVLPETKLLADLEFGPLQQLPLKENELEIQIKAVSLNFLDLFVVLKPIPQFDGMLTVGRDFAGVVTKVGSELTKKKVGDRVLGSVQGTWQPLSSHINLDEDFTMHLPDSMTFAEGSTLPVVFGTVQLCLLKAASMKRGDTVLVHTASGGVGLCAIQVAKHMGVEVIATAGSKKKRSYLRNLGVKHVFHSRNTEFEKGVLEVTNGRGVDIVLNSLTGPGFKEASLNALGKNGRFIEMSKLNVWTAEEVKEMRPDVLYRIEDLLAVPAWEIKTYMVKLEQYLYAGVVHPIPFERFDLVNIRGAFGYMQKAKHVGKIVCVMPELRIESSKIVATTPLFNERSTYLVTGGLGGIGWEVVKWMLSSGAKYLVIASRSRPKPEIAKQLEAWHKGGKCVEAFSVDIGDFQQCQSLFKEIQSSERGLPPLRGVMHVAGVLQDAIVDNQSWDNFRLTYNPKVSGTWNLHDLTKNMLLEHFVLFSSMAATIGSPGQSNHAASNQFEDALAAHRRFCGLPASSINWGNWGEVGIATELDFPGVRPISTAQGLLVIDRVLRTQDTHLGVMNFDSFSLAAKIFPSLKTFVDDSRLLGDIKSAAIINSDEFWKNVDSAEDREGKFLVFKGFIKTILRNILKMDPDEVIDDLTDFQSLGIDSLMMLEMKNGLQSILGSRMTVTTNQLKDCNNTDMMANRLVGILLGEDDDGTQILIPSKEELSELVREDYILPDHIKPGDGSQVKDISEVETVLLLGATGLLGPYLLRELSHRQSIKKIYCLVRKVEKVQLMDRLESRLKTMDLLDQVDLSKVECLQGDITDRHFGLSDELYTTLAGDVDAIFNSAVRSDHTAKYWRCPESRKVDVRTVNVLGTIRVLEFAVESKLKHVYHASTLLSVLTTDEEDCFNEDWEAPGSFDKLPVNSGYPLSKHIGEQLVKTAIERGIPCKTFRHPGIGGDSKTGRCDALSNHIMLRWISFLKLKVIPDMPSPILMVPVDHCAQASLELFFNPSAPHDIYNISHKDSGVDQILIDIALEDFGITIQPVSFSQFVAKLQEEGPNSPLAPFKKLYEDEVETVQENMESSAGRFPALQKFVDNNSNFLRSRKLAAFLHNYERRFEPTSEVMRRDVRFLKESGLFEKFGIR